MRRSRDSTKDIFMRAYCLSFLDFIPVSAVGEIGKSAPLNAFSSSNNCYLREQCNIHITEIHAHGLSREHRHEVIIHKYCSEVSCYKSDVCAHFAPVFRGKLPSGRHD